MAFSTQADIPVQVIVPNDAEPGGRPLLSAERRITPAWTVSQLKSKLEPITGIPASAQSLRTRGLDGSWIYLSEETALVGDAKYALRRGSEVEIIDTRPANARQTFNFADLSSVEKYQMPETQYEKLEDSVLAWKRRQRLGRFDPNAKSTAEAAEERTKHDQAQIEAKGIQVGSRCRVGNDDGRRGTVRFTGEVPGLGGTREAGCVWVGIELDEPVGRNDGSVVVEMEEEEDAGGDGDGAGPPQTHAQTKRVFQCRDKFGVFIRPEKVQVGDFPPLDDLMDEDMDEV
jgi:tubulin-folding cofactor B